MVIIFVLKELFILTGTLLTDCYIWVHLHFVYGKVNGFTTNNQASSMIDKKTVFFMTQSIPRAFAGFANFIDEWSHCDFCFTNFGVILEYLESSITTKKAIFRLSSTWSWHVYTIVRDTRSSCGGPLTWKAQIHDGGHRVNFDRNLPSSCFVMQYNSLISMI